MSVVMVKVFEPTLAVAESQDQSVVPAPLEARTHQVADFPAPGSSHSTWPSEIAPDPLVE